MADLERQATEVRKNMQRLRALRETKEADEVRSRTVRQQPLEKKRKRRIVR
jgi:hypothetical protein